MGRCSISTGSGSHIHYQLWKAKKALIRCSQGLEMLCRCRGWWKRQGNKMASKTVNYTSGESAKAVIGLYKPLQREYKTTWKQLEKALCQGQTCVTLQRKRGLPVNTQHKNLYANTWNLDRYSTLGCSFLLRHLCSFSSSCPQRELINYSL